jgi:predicted DNA-binding transcriptional regulator AlpA
MSTKYKRRRHRTGKRALTVRQFCDKYGLGRATYYDLRKKGLGPREMRIANRIIRISPQADADWVARMEAGESAPVATFAPKPSGGGKTRKNDRTTARREEIQSRKRASLTTSKPSNRDDLSTGAMDTMALRHKKQGASNSRHREPLSMVPTDRALIAAPKSSVHRNTNDEKRQKKRSQQLIRADAPSSPSRADDDAGPRRRKGCRKKPQRKCSKEPRAGRVSREPQVGIAELKRHLRTGKRLPKDALIESSRWRLDSNCHRKRDCRIERAILQALTGAGSSDVEQRQAVDQANCTPESPCRRLVCWLCKHRTWFSFRRNLPDVLKNGVPHDEISFVTIVIGVCEPLRQALHRPMSKFRSWLAKAADAWNVSFFGRFEVDLLPDPRLDLHSTPF